jgi:hypothetical protein
VRLAIIRWWARYCLRRAQFYTGECWGRQAGSGYPASDGWDARAPRDWWYARYDVAMAKIEAAAVHVEGNAAGG